MKNDFAGILLILGIIAVALYGGVNNAKNSGTIGGSSSSKKTDVKTLIETEREVEELRKQIQEEEYKRNKSKYSDMVTISSLIKSSDPNKEYLTIKVSSRATTTVPVTGWRISSNYSPVSVYIPKASYLYFSGMQNAEENVVLKARDTLYVITGHSPLGVGFRSNKCTGYLDQFQTFTPSLVDNCPLPENIATQYINDNLVNESCLRYIDSLRRCEINTKNIPLNWTAECKNFISEKINYPYCIKTHKNDSDFYENEWRVYLKRSDSIWTARRQTITLYDNEGKIVDTIER